MKTDLGILAFALIAALGVLIVAVILGSCATVDVPTPLPTDDHAPTGTVPPSETLTPYPWPSGRPTQATLTPTPVTYPWRQVWLPKVAKGGK